MNKKCNICGRTQGLFILELDFDGEPYERHVCGSCWDVIAGIVIKVLEAKELLPK